MTEKVWAEQFIGQVATRMKEIRKGQKLSIRALSERTEILGHHIGESVLSNFEYKRRGSKLEVVELLVIAAALGVPPILLLLPKYPDGEVEYLPGVTAQSFDVADWISGDASLVIEDLAGGQGIHPRGDFAVSRVRERQRLVNQAFELFSAGVGDAQELVTRAERRKMEINRELDQAGYVVDQSSYIPESDGEG